MMIKDPKDYFDPRTQEYSKRVKSCGGFVFVCPEYNHSYPAAMKSMVDQLYHEFSGKPGVIISYGGGGGEYASNALKGLFQMTKIIPAAVVNIQLPGELIATDKRIPSPYNPRETSFLAEYEDTVREAFKTLKENLESYS